MLPFFRVSEPESRTRVASFRAGYTQVELIVMLAVLGLVISISIPSLWQLSARLRLELACAEVASMLRLTQSHAVRWSDRVGLKFHPAEGRVRWAIYRDGDGDGVRNADIRRGIDPAVTVLRNARHLGSAAWFGFPLGMRPRDPTDPRRRLDRLDDPIRFNRSDLAVFSDLGTATPGTLYLTNGQHLAAVRVNNRAGRVRVMFYDARQEIWR